MEASKEIFLSVASIAIRGVSILTLNQKRLLTQWNDSGITDGHGSAKISLFQFDCTSMSVI